MRPARAFPDPESRRAAPSPHPDHLIDCDYGVTGLAEERNPQIGGNRHHRVDGRRNHSGTESTEDDDHNGGRLEDRSKRSAFHQEGNDDGTDAYDQSRYGGNVQTHVFHTLLSAGAVLFRNNNVTAQVAHPPARSKYRQHNEILETSALGWRVGNFCAHLRHSKNDSDRNGTTTPPRSAVTCLPDVQMMHRKGV